MATSVCSIIDSRGQRVAEIDLHRVEDEWYYGRLLSDTLPEELRRDLDWYDQVVSDQMLSYLDDALYAVGRHELSVRLPDESCHRAYSLHIEKSGETTFRITPLLPPNANRFESSVILG